MIVELCLLLRIVLNENLNLARLSVTTCEGTKEPVEEIQSVQNFKMPSKDYPSTPNTWEINPNLNSMWAYRPAPAAQHPGDQMARTVLVRSPKSLTKLAKSLTLGYDPYFEKDFFEPFERRQRPVTLVGFRKNGFLPRIHIKGATGNTGEIAELQSPFNEISSFWQEEHETLRK
ncbi:unnamed protein product [Parnassius apollo]|uniref:(apollo) hypothetical protein n=1 Tax=Parnassius apollo TaxID=110799 RepID=A0A8S3WX40_PARAO|nr:unnamed protein product [Parnassius apollo]